MNTATLDSRVSEFDTEEAASSHDRWFCAKVKEAIDDPRPGIAHDQVMAEIDAMVDAIETAQKICTLKH